MSESKESKDGKASKGATGKKWQRRQFSPDDKAAILRRHLVDRVPVSDLCDEYKIQPALF